MKILYLDCGMGAAGDMLSAALWELLPEPEEALRTLNGAFGGRIIFRAEELPKCGICATHMAVIAEGEQEGEPERQHHHASLADMYKLIDSAALPMNVRQDAGRVFRLVAEAEAAVHGSEPENIHFHELGSLDAAADVLAVSYFISLLAPDKICASPISTGSGFVSCAHGLLPVPAPAAAELLRGLPIRSGGVRGELCTPTGAALLKYFVSDFGDMPCMRLLKTGMGAGKKDFPRANLLRAMLGQVSGEESDRVLELCCNLDDTSPEALGFCMERLFDAGALDVYFINIGMKKCRPGVMLCCLCRPESREEMLRCIFRHTGTIGVREQLCRRSVLSRSTVSRSSSYGPVRVKLSRGFGVSREKPEYEDLAAIARNNGISLSEAAESLRKEAEEK